MSRTIPASFPLKYYAQAGGKIVDGDGTATHPGMMATGLAANFCLAKVGLNQHINEQWWSSPWAANGGTTRIPSLAGSYWKCRITPSWTSVRVRFLVQSDAGATRTATIYSRSDSVATSIVVAGPAYVDASDVLGVSETGWEEIYVEIETDDPTKFLYLVGLSVWEEPRTTL